MPCQHLGFILMEDKEVIMKSKKIVKHLRKVDAKPQMESRI
jgi:hypothetical protein